MTTRGSASVLSKPHSIVYRFEYPVGTAPAEANNEVGPSPCLARNKAYSDSQGEKIRGGNALVCSNFEGGNTGDTVTSASLRGCNAELDKQAAVMAKVPLMNEYVVVRDNLQATQKLVDGTDYFKEGDMASISLPDISRIGGTAPTPASLQPQSAHLGRSQAHSIAQR